QYLASTIPLRPSERVGPPGGTCRIRCPATPRKRQGATGWGIGAFVASCRSPSAMRCGPEEQPLAAAAGSAGKWLFANPGSVANLTVGSGVADGGSSGAAESAELTAGT